MGQTQASYRDYTDRRCCEKRSQKRMDADVLTTQIHNGLSNKMSKRNNKAATYRIQMISKKGHYTQNKTSTT